MAAMVQIGPADSDRFVCQAAAAQRILTDAPLCAPAGVAWFSAASLLLPAALSEPVRVAGLALPAVLLARMCVVSGTSPKLCCCSSLGGSSSRSGQPPARLALQGVAQHKR